MCRYVRKARPHAVLSFLNYPNAVLLLASRRLRGETRILVSVRNHMSAAAGANELNWVRSVPRLMRRLFGRADAVVAPSQGVAADVAAITGLAPDRISVIYNPVFRPELATLAEAPVDHPWLAEGNEPVVLGVGKLKIQKDFPTLLRAFAQVRNRRPARLIILGEGGGAAELMALAANLGIGGDVDFCGQVQNPFAFYRRAAVFVLSSRWEGLPNALIEAMACGCAVVSTDCPSGPREILEGGRYGALVPVGDAEAMAAAILAVLADPPAPAAADRAGAAILARGGGPALRSGHGRLTARPRTDETRNESPGRATMGIKTSVALLLARAQGAGRLFAADRHHRPAVADGAGGRSGRARPPPGGRPCPTGIPSPPTATARISSASTSAPAGSRPSISRPTRMPASSTT